MYIHVGMYISASNVCLYIRKYIYVCLHLMCECARMYLCMYVCFYINTYVCTAASVYTVHMYCIY